MKLWAIKCPTCHDTIFSRARHDFRACSCEAVFIDGGFDYTRYGGDNATLIEIEIDATKQQLYNDWNNRIDKLGIIHEKNATNS
jgi:hypothetical protein